MPLKNWKSYDDLKEYTSALEEAFIIHLTELTQAFEEHNYPRCKVVLAKLNSVKYQVNDERSFRKNGAI